MWVYFASYGHAVCQSAMIRKYTLTIQFIWNYHSACPNLL